MPRVHEAYTIPAKSTFPCGFGWLILPGPDIRRIVFLVRRLQSQRDRTQVSPDVMEAG